MIFDALKQRPRRRMQLVLLLLLSFITATSSLDPRFKQNEFKGATGGRRMRCPSDARGKQCSGHGLCRKGLCLCDPGYRGADCGRATEENARAARTADGRPKYGRAYAAQLKKDLEAEMARRKAENAGRMARLRAQFKTQNREIEEQRESVQSKLDAEKKKNQVHIDGMQEQRSKETAAIRENSERIKKQVEGVGSGMSEKLQDEYDEHTAESTELREEAEDEKAPPSAVLNALAEEENYDIVQNDPDDERLFRKTKEKPKVDAKGRDAARRKLEQRMSKGAGAGGGAPKRPKMVQMDGKASDAKYDTVALDDEDEDDGDDFA